MRPAKQSGHRPAIIADNGRRGSTPLCRLRVLDDRLTSAAVWPDGVGERCSDELITDPEPHWRRMCDFGDLEWTRASYHWAGVWREFLRRTELDGA